MFWKAGGILLTELFIQKRKIVINCSILVKSDLTVALKSWAFLIRTMHCISFICTSLSLLCKIFNISFFKHHPPYNIPSLFHLRFQFCHSMSLKTILDFYDIESFYMKAMCKKHKLFYTVQKKPHSIFAVEIHHSGFIQDTSKHKNVRAQFVNCQLLLSSWGTW